MKSQKATLWARSGASPSSAGPPRQPSRDRLLLAGVRLAEQPPECRLLIVPHEEVVADRHEGGVAPPGPHALLRTRRNRSQAARGARACAVRAGCGSPATRVTPGAPLRACAKTGSGVFG